MFSTVTISNAAIRDLLVLHKFRVLSLTYTMSLSTHKYRDAAQKANAHLEMLASLDKVYADPKCRSLLRAIADNDGINLLSHDALGDNRVHVERVLSYFHTKAPESLLVRKAQKNTRPCRPCSISKVKVYCSLSVNDPNLTELIPVLARQ